MSEIEEELKALQGLVKKKEKKVELVKQELQKEELKDKPEFSLFGQKKEKKSISREPEPLLDKKEVKKDKTSGFLKEKESVKPEKSFLGENPKTDLNPLANFYYFFEDKYYALLDKINNFIPVYKVIDPIDKFIPSFVLFIGLILLVLVLLSSFFVIPVEPEKATLTINVIKEDSGQVLADRNIFVFIDAKKNIFITDENGTLVLNDLDLNSSVKVKVKNVRDYRDFEKIIKVTEKETFFTVKLEKEEEVDSGWASKTIRFKDEAGNPVTDLLRVAFECSGNKSGFKIKNKNGLTKRVENGVVQIEVKESCGNVLVSVTSADYEKIEKEVLVGTVVTLIKKSQPEGTIHIKVKYDGELIGEKMRFALFEEGTTEPINGFSDERIPKGGTKSFDRVPGSYFIKVFDANSSNPKYDCPDSSETKELTDGEEIEFEVECFLLSPDYAISVNVIGAVSKVKIDSTIELRKKIGDKFEFVSVLKNVSSVTFAVSDGNKYIVLVSSKGYLPYEGEDLLTKGQSLTVELTKATEQTAGKALVKVFDADNNPTSGAKVYLIYSEGRLKDLRTPYFALVGFDGETLIEGIKPGKYYAEAFNNTQKGFSQENTVDVNTVTDFSVNMEKVRGFVELSITKLNSSQEIEGFDVEFFDALEGRKIRESEYVFLPLTETYSFDTGEYYAVILKNGYYSIQTSSFVVARNAKTYVNVQMRQKQENDTSILIDFIGLKKNGLVVSSLDLGEEYTAEFNLTVDSDSGIFFFNFLVGTGKEYLMENDSLFISSVLTPFSDAIELQKTISFTGNFNADFISNATQGDAKAVLVSFDDFDEAQLTAESFVIQVKIKLKDKILDANNLSLFYKALAAAGSAEETEYYLDPADGREFSSVQARTYSNPKTEEIDLCKEDFCYSFLVENASADPSCSVISFGSVSSVKVNCPYELFSFVLNNKKDYGSIDFSVENSALDSPYQDLDAVQFTDYLIETNLNPFSGTANDRIIEVSFPLNEKELVYVNSDFVPVKLIKKDFKVPAIQTKLSKTGVIDRNFFELKIRSDININISTNPVEVSAFTETDLIVEVLDGEGNPIEDAAVKIRIDDLYSFGPLATDNLGKAVFDGGNKIPELNPNSEISITAEVDDATKTKTIYVGEPVTFSFIPETFTMIFPPTDNTVHVQDLNFFSLTEEDSGIVQEITFYSIDFANNSEFFNEQSLNGYRREFTPEGILTKIKLSLDTNQTENLNSTVFIDANLNLTIEIGNGTGRGYPYDKQIPFKVLVNPLSEYVKAEFRGNEATNQNPVVVSLFSDSTAIIGEFDLIRKNTLADEIKIKEIQLELESGYLDLDQTEFSLKSNEERLIPFSSALNLAFNVYLEETAQYLEEKKISKGNIFFLFEADGESDFLMVPFKVEIIPADDALKTSLSGINYVFYLQEEAEETLTKTVNFKSESSIFPVTITNAVFEFNSDLIAEPSEGAVEGMDLPATIRSNGRDANFTLELTEIGKAITTSRQINVNLNISYTAKGKNLTELIPVNVSILSVPGDIEAKNFDLEACVGEGALNDSGTKFNVNFWIGCNIGEAGTTDLKKCSTEKPKVQLDWAFTSFNADAFDGNSSCTKSSLSDTDYVYCDATQFSMDLVSRIINFKRENDSGSFAFKSTLISDNFSDKFFEDFDYWVMNTSPLVTDAPAYYIQGTGDADYGLVRYYFDQQRIGVKVNGEDKTEITVPGWYNVNVIIEDNGLELEFDLQKTSFQLEREKDYAFYYTPLDGQVGLKENLYNRLDYGSNFDVRAPLGEFRVKDSGFTVFSSEELNDNSKSLFVTQNNDFGSLNSAEIKGTLMKLLRDVSSGVRDMDFYPSYATPLVMKAFLKEEADPALLYYSILTENGQELLIQGNDLIEWTGLGENCIDFSGGLIKDKSYSDIKADETDESIIGSYDKTFKLIWPGALHDGNSFFSSIAFAPVNAENPIVYLNIKRYAGNPFEFVQLHSKDPDDKSNPDAEKNWIELDGIPGVNLNQAPNSYVNSLEDLFDLIESSDACVRNEGNVTYILWNKEKIMEEMAERINNLNIDLLCMQE